MNFWKMKQIITCHYCGGELEKHGNQTGLWYECKKCNKTSGSEPLKAPFPWFGGKSRVAHIVWEHLHDVDNYVEPFAGSLAVLLGRPLPIKGVETVNDIDCYIANFWRAVKNDPAGVAKYANNPVNEADLTARHIWLVNTGKERIQRLFGDPNYYDVQVAGWWVWGISCWIGSGFCSGRGSWTVDSSGRLVRKGEEEDDEHTYRDENRGVDRKRPHIGNTGVGVNRMSLRSGDNTIDGHTGIRAGEDTITAYLNQLAERLRYVRVCCGDWKRVVTKGVLNTGSVTGIFLDPPYDTTIRCDHLYTHDEAGVNHDVYEWAIEHQDEPNYRIILCGYEGEYEIPKNWTTIKWVSGRANADNRFKERLWISPQCKRKGISNLINTSLFDFFNSTGESPGVTEGDA